MTAHDDELGDVLRPWMHSHAPDAPSHLVLRVYGEIEAMSERTTSISWLSRFAGLQAAAAAVASIVLVIGIALVGLYLLPNVGSEPGPTPTPSSRPGDPTAVADALIAAWNAGDGQQAASFYDPTPTTLVVGSFMIDSGSVTTEFTLDDVAATVAAWHAAGSELTRAGAVLSQGPYVAFPVTWTTASEAFSGAEILRLSTTGVVAEHYLIGASATKATGTAEGSDVVSGIHDGMLDIAARLGAASGDLFALDAVNYEFQDGIGGEAAAGRATLTDVLNGAPNPVPATVGTVVTNGPFALYAVSNPITTGGTEEGFDVLEVNGSGLLQHSWAIRAAMTP